MNSRWPATTSGFVFLLRICVHDREGLSSPRGHLHFDPFDFLRVPFTGLTENVGHPSEEEVISEKQQSAVSIPEQQICIQKMFSLTLQFQGYQGKKQRVKVKEPSVVSKCCLMPQVLTTIKFTASVFISFLT